MPNLPDRLPPYKDLQKLIDFCNALRDCTESLFPRNSLDTLTTHTSIGVSRQGNGQQAFPVRSKPYLITAIKPDYLECLPLILNDDGDDLEIDPNGGPTYIAKAPGHRRKGWDGKTIDGVKYAFDPDVLDATTRVATDATNPGTSQTEKITPNYVVWAGTIYPPMIIYADEVDEMGLEAQIDPNDPTVTLTIILLDQNRDGRAWAKV